MKRKTQSCKTWSAFKKIFFILIPESALTRALMLSLFCVLSIFTVAFWIFHLDFQVPLFINTMTFEKQWNKWNVIIVYKVERSMCYCTLKWNGFIPWYASEKCRNFMLKSWTCEVQVLYISALLFLWNFHIFQWKNVI